MQSHSKAFLACLRIILNAEKGVSDRPPDEDPGRLTNRGITHGTLDHYRASHPEDSDMPVSVRELTEAQAARIYYAMFWAECRCDEMPPSIAIVVFNAAVQSGPRDAIRWLQNELRVVQDGVIGPITLRALRSVNDLDDLISRYMQAELFYEMTLRNWPPNKRGWTRRLFLVAINTARVSGPLVTIDHVREGSAPIFQHDRNI